MNSNYFKLLDNNSKLLEKKNKELYEVFIEKTKADLIKLYEQKQYSRSDYYKAEQYYALLSSIDKRLKELGATQETILTEALTNMYKEIKKVVGLDIGKPMIGEMFNPEPIIKTIWCRDGLAYDQRIWRNNGEVQETLTNGITEIIMRGGSKEDLIEDLIPLCTATGNSAFYRARTLANTELAYVRAQATLDSYREAGIEEYVFMNTDDDKQCDECGKMNGKKFKVKDAVIGDNFPPIHPNCRGWTKAVI